MNKLSSFFVGVIVGIIFTLIFATLLANSSESSESENSITGLSFFDSPGQVMDVQEYKIIQVIDDEYALATALSDKKYNLYTGIVVLLVSNGESGFYDDKIIKAPKGKFFRQIGTYRYENRIEMLKTVPAIGIFDE